MIAPLRWPQLGLQSPLRCAVNDCDTSAQLTGFHFALCGGIVEGGVELGLGIEIETLFADDSGECGVDLAGRPLRVEAAAELPRDRVAGPLDIDRSAAVSHRQIVFGELLRERVHVALAHADFRIGTAGSRLSELREAAARQPNLVKASFHGDRLFLRRVAAASRQSCRRQQQPSPFNFTHAIPPFGLGTPLFR